MAHEDWVVGGDRHTAAAERIYAAATELILSQGLDAFDVDALAAELHCSRATVYRYAGGKAQIRDAVLLRLATGIIDTVRSTVAGMTGQQRVMAAITVALDQIKSDPLRRLMLESGHAVQPGELHASPVLSHLAAELTGITDAGLANLKDAKHLTYLNLYGTPVTDAKYFGTGFGIAVAKGNQELLTQLNKGLAEIKANGTYQKIFDKYFAQ